MRDPIEFIKAIDRKQKLDFTPSGNFTASVMRSVRSLSDEHEESLIEAFLNRMMYFSSSCALTIFLCAVMYAQAFQADVVNYLIFDGVGTEALISTGLPW